MSSYDVIADSIDYLVAHVESPPDLEALAQRAGYEVTYFQKLFKQHVGISPKRLVQFMHLNTARDFLLRGYSTLDTAYAAGLSSGSRLHDLFVSCEGITPGAVQRRGQGMHIVYGVLPTALGHIILAKTSRGICWAGFMMQQSEVHCLERIARHFPLAVLRRDDAALQGEAAQVIRLWGRPDPEEKGGSTLLPLALDLYGTNLQLQVWQALLRIPMGASVSYKVLATHVGKPKASRAVGNAVGANPVSLLIPCHRVIRASGVIDNYGWGSPRKKALLAIEGAQMGTL